MKENDDNFEALQRLIALKRHETPPLGYFNDFSGNVVARLRAGEAAEMKGFSERLFNEAPWLVKFLQIFEAKPAFVGGFAATLCLLLLGGIVYSERDDAAPDSTLISALSPTAPVANTVAAASPTAAQLPVAADATEQAGGLAVATNYSLQPVATMFGQQNFFTQPQPVSFSPSGN